MKFIIYTHTYKTEINDLILPLSLFGIPNLKFIRKVNDSGRTNINILM